MGRSAEAGEVRLLGLEHHHVILGSTLTASFAQRLESHLGLKLRRLARLLAFSF